LLLAGRAALCDTLAGAGPDAPTLCEGWRTTELAAHLLVRETRPDAAIGILLPGPFAKHTERVMAHTARKMGYERMVEALRNGPPRLSRLGPMAAANVVEDWVHHEDVRRAAGDGPRPSTPELDDLLWASLRLAPYVSGRRLHDTGLVLQADDGRERVVKDATPRVVVRGAVGELVLFMQGRKEAAVVTTDGPPEAVAVVLATRFGV
jgi:uncharacterized protein (TIGR03085 family)